jgi:hypothetical protein
MSLLTLPVIRPNTTTLLPLEEYDLFLVSFSGGKESLSLVLDLLERGVSRERVQLWHQCVDGRPGVDPRFMDWPCTESYAKAVANALGVRLLFSWREGGFLAEILKQGDRSRPVVFERQDGSFGQAGGIKGKISTRRRFPQPAGNLMVRWCSAALKIDVARMAIANDPALWGAKICYLSGERRLESTNRSRLAELEEHACNNKSRRVDHWRSVVTWHQQKVWGLMERHRVMPHPTYRLGFPRVSCMSCIFADADQWASIRVLDPERFALIAHYEREFGVTINYKRGVPVSVEELADEGTPYPELADVEVRSLAMGEHYPADLAVVPDGEPWQLPAGAFKRGGGPS